eukprot:c24454_g1_i1 orf=567-1358(+)
MEDGYEGITRSSYRLKVRRQDRHFPRTKLDHLIIPGHGKSESPARVDTAAGYAVPIIDTLPDAKTAIPLQSLVQTPPDLRSGRDEVRLDIDKAELAACREQCAILSHHDNYSDAGNVLQFDEHMKPFITKDITEKQAFGLEPSYCNDSKICALGGSITSERRALDRPMATLSANKPSCKKPPRPPIPARPALDPSNDRLTKTSLDESLKMARFDKARSKRRKLTTSTWNATSVWAFVVTLCFIFVVMVQGNLHVHVWGYSLIL